jgi:hypothetical protein
MTLTFLISNYSYSQCNDCDKIEMKYDDIEEQTIISMYAGKFYERSLSKKIYGILGTTIYFQKSDTIYLLNLRVTNYETLTFLKDETSLKIETDFGKLEYQTYDSKIELGDFYNIYDIQYIYKLNDLIKIINSKEVKLFIYPSIGSYDYGSSIEFSFSEETFNCFLCFYKKYLKKK